MITENEIIEIFKNYKNEYTECDPDTGQFMYKTFVKIPPWIDINKLAKAIIDKIKDRDIDKESKIIRESKIYEEESGLLEEDKI